MAKPPLRNDQRKNSTKTTEKKPLPPPIHVGHIVVVVIMKISKKVLLMDTSVKIGVYLIGVMIGSVFADMVQLPKSYLSDKTNFLNQYFVKLGWGWTLVGLTVYIGMSSFVYSLGKWTTVKIHMLRLLMATFWWYTTVSLLGLIESVIGVCSDRSYTYRYICMKNGKSWLGFDISGHVFLLIHNLLTISEEVRCFKDWSKLGEMLEDTEGLKNRNFKMSEVKDGRIAYKSLTPYIKGSVVFLACLMVLWEFMLIISTIYRFHTTSQKIAAAFIAVGCWFVSYRIILGGIGKIGSLKLLLRPGEGPLRFTKYE